MLLTGFSKEIFKSKCDSSALGVHCHANLNNDISGVLPYLNTELGGSSYTKEPPSVTFKIHGKLITVHSKKIAINALKDDQEAQKILEWLQREINSVWDRHQEIEPSYESASKPILFEVLKLLPKTNCKECNEPTCMVFAAKVVEGVKDQNDCLPISSENKDKLKNYMAQFKFYDPI